MQATEMMQGVSKPARLYRVDTNLWSLTPKPETNTAAAVETSAVDCTPTSASGANSDGCHECTGPDVSTGGNVKTEARAGELLTAWPLALHVINGP